MKKILFFSTCLLLILPAIPLNSTAQIRNVKGDILRKQIEDYIKSEMKVQQIPGLAYAVLMNGNVISSGAFGVSNAELLSPTTLYTKFAIGSIGKTLTATAVMLLLKEGKLSPDEPINRYIDTLPPLWDKITIRNLQSHTHDFPGYSYIEKRDRKMEYIEADLSAGQQNYH